MAWSYEINPAKSLNGASSRLLNGPLQKISTFRGAQDFFGLLNGTRRQPSAINPAKSLNGASRDFLQGTIKKP